MKNFIGLNIRNLYEENRLSQNEFGELFGLKKGVVSTYVNGKTNPQIETLQKICDYFKISLDELVNQDLRKLQRPHNENYIRNNMAKEPAPQSITEETLRSWLDDKDKMIRMLEAEVKRLKGKQDYGSKTA